MGIDTRAIADVLRRATASSSGKPNGSAAAPPAPAARGYTRFTVGGRVLDLVTANEARIVASYTAAAAPAIVYEILFDDGVHGVRLERELELARPKAPAPAEVR